MDNQNYDRLITRLHNCNTTITSIYAFFNSTTSHSPQTNSNKSGLNHTTHSTPSVYRSVHFKRYFKAKLTTNFSTILTSDSLTAFNTSFRYNSSPKGNFETTSKTRLIFNSTKPSNRYQINWIQFKIQFNQFFIRSLNRSVNRFQQRIQSVIKTRHQSGFRVVHRKRHFSFETIQLLKQSQRIVTTITETTERLEYFNQSDTNQHSFTSSVKTTQKSNRYQDFASLQCSTVVNRGLLTISSTPAHQWLKIILPEVNFACCQLISKSNWPCSSEKGILQTNSLKKSKDCSHQQFTEASNSCLLVSNQITSKRHFGGQPLNMSFTISTSRLRIAHTIYSTIQQQIQQHLNRTSSIVSHFFCRKPSAAAFLPSTNHLIDQRIR